MVENIGPSYYQDLIPSDRKKKTSFEYKLDNFRVANYPDEWSLLLLQINLNGFKS